MNAIANIFKAFFSLCFSIAIIVVSFPISWLILNAISESFLSTSLEDFEFYKVFLVICLISALFLGFKLCTSIYTYSLIGYLKRGDAKHKQILKENEIKAIEIATKQLKEQAAALEKQQKEEDYLNELKSAAALEKKQKEEDYLNELNSIAEDKKKEAETKLAETMSKYELAVLDLKRQEELAVNELKRLRESTALKIKETQMKSATLSKDLALKKSNEIKNIDNIKSEQEEHFHYCKKCRIGTMHTVVKSKKDESGWAELLFGFGFGDDITMILVTFVISVILVISIVGIAYLLYKLLIRPKPDYELNCVECGAFHSPFQK